jgi:hypothetical protein
MTRLLLLSALLLSPHYLAPNSAPAADAKPPARSRAAVKLTEEALRIHRAALLIDGHNDLPWQFRTWSPARQGISRSPAVSRPSPAPCIVASFKPRSRSQRRAR